MNNHCGYVVEIKQLRPHSNADKLQIATFFNSDTCVSLDAKVGDIGIYFPSDLQLGLNFCVKNHLLRKTPDGKDDVGYLEANRHVRAIRLRCEKSDGIYLPLSCLKEFGDISTLNVGDTIDTFNGHEICKKYIPHDYRYHSMKAKEAGKKKIDKTKLYPHFCEHIDTPQLRFCMEAFKPGDIICLTEKVHGTSARHGLTLVNKNNNWFTRLFKINKNKYEYVTGTRRTIVDSKDGGFYGTNAFRLKWAEAFKDKLYPGEEVFGEIAGFLEDGTPIMAVGNNKKTNDKAFIKKFGETTTFSYGCKENENKFFIYRMTYTSPEGYCIEYSWDQVKLRAEQMGFNVVPELDRFIYTTEEEFIQRISQWLDIPSTLDSTHIIEGVVVRALNKPDFAVAKEKSYNFKVIEGIIKAEAEAPDMEEVEDLM